MFVGYRWACFGELSGRNRRKTKRAKTERGKTKPVHKGYKGKGSETNPKQLKRKQNRTLTGAGGWGKK
ncbi:hypothetical protein B0H12DRAFT_1101445 [Mycena haematopus]|nr:hypothetical protein B0H12DRAFT_1101445 [Mycena haematopus]